MDKIRFGRDRMTLSKAIAETAAEMQRRRAAAEEMPYNTTPLPPRKEATGQTQLPLTRVKKTIALDPEVQICSNNAAFVITLATELFIQHLAVEAQAMAKADRKPRRNIQYKDFANAIQHRDNLEFLQDVVPKTTPYREIKALAAAMQAKLRGDGGGDSQDQRSHLTNGKKKQKPSPPSSSSPLAAVNGSGGGGGRLSTASLNGTGSRGLSGVLAAPIISMGSASIGGPPPPGGPLAAAGGGATDDDDDDDAEGPSTQLELEMRQASSSSSAAPRAAAGDGDVDMTG